MLNMDISNLWSGMSLPDLLGWEAQLAEAQRRLQRTFSEEFSDWMWRKDTVPKELVNAIRNAARRIRMQSDTLVIIGADEALLGIRGALEMLRGTRHNEIPTKPRIHFAGGDLSTRDLRELLNLLDDREFSVCFITYRGTNVEPALAFRALKWKLIDKYGEQAARERIYVVTEEEERTLFNKMQEQGIAVFDTPRRVGGRFSVLSAVGLLPLLVAGIDPMDLLAGAAEMQEQLSLGSFDNPAWLYCAGRRVLWESGRSIELLVSSEPRMQTLGKFWQHLFADYPGPLTLSALYGRDARLADDRLDVFETYLRTDAPEDPLAIPSEWDDTDTMSFLEGRSFADAEAALLDGVMGAHLGNGIPAFLLESGRIDAKLAGALLHFLEFSAALWMLLIGEDPFAPRPLSEARKTMLSTLGACGFSS